MPEDKTTPSSTSRPWNLAKMVERLHPLRLLAALPPTTDLPDGEQTVTGREPTAPTLAAPTLTAPTSAVDGQTSDPLPFEIHVAGRQSCALVERHRITADVTSAMVASKTHRDAIELALRQGMDAWCAAHGTAPAPRSVSQYHRLPVGEESEALVIEWDVMVGRAAIDPNQAVPGVLDNWTWSGRVDFWRYFFGRFEGGRKGRVLAAREDGLASVTDIRRQAGHSPRSLNPFADLADRNAERMFSMGAKRTPPPDGE